MLAWRVALTGFVEVSERTEHAEMMLVWQEAPTGVAEEPEYYKLMLKRAAEVVQWVEGCWIVEQVGKCLVYDYTKVGLHIPKAAVHFARQRVEFVAVTEVVLDYLRLEGHLQPELRGRH